MGTEGINRWLLPGAIMLASVILAAGIATGLLLSKARQRYAVSALPFSTRPAVWRLDTWTGKVEVCTSYPLQKDPKDPFADLVEEENGGPMFPIRCLDSVGFQFMTGEKWIPTKH